MRVIRLFAVLFMIGAMVAIAPGVAEAAPPTTICNGGLSAGGYGHVIVPVDTVCFAESGIVIRQGVEVLQGATFALGDESDPTPSKILQGVTATNAANVQIHFTRITGGINIKGGSGPVYSASPFCFPECITWNTIEDSSITGEVVISGYNGFWHGFIRNQVAGNVWFMNNKVADTDGNEFVTNTINGNLRCAGNNPPPQTGDSGGGPNVVTGQQGGQCAFT